MFARKLLQQTTKISHFRHVCSSQIINQTKMDFKGAKQVKHFGQPTAATHPHLIKDGEVVPLITVQEFRERRHKLVESILKHSIKKAAEINQHIIIIPAGTKKYMSDKIPYAFRQDSEFLYLTGCQEPDTCLVIALDNVNKYTCTLFTRPQDAHSETWDGPRTGPHDAVQIFGVDQALPITELSMFLKRLQNPKKSSLVWFDFNNPTSVSTYKIIKDFFTELFNRRWDSPVPLIHRLRLIKSPAEINLMKKSCEIASEAFVNAIRTSKPGISEHQVFAQVDYNCKMSGAEVLAYPPVIAGGNRATIIHYINNNQVVNNGEMILMDAGCEYHGYSSDITRTWPVNGRFSKEQRELYELVLSVQCDLIEMLRNMPTLDRLFSDMCLLMGKRLQELGLIFRSLSPEIIIKGAYEFCPHHVSHYLGMDVHDTPTVPRNIPVQPGMIVTVEPGVYVSNQIKGVPNEYRGIGVRVEDDVLITENGPVVLSAKCPKSTSDIENIATYEMNRI